MIPELFRRTGAAVVFVAVVAAFWLAAAWVGQAATGPVVESLRDSWGTHDVSPVVTVIDP